MLFQEGDVGDGLYGILEGRVAFTVDSVRGKALTLNVLGPGEFFGEIALLDGKGRTATAVARDSCRLLFISRTAFMAFLKERPDAALHVSHAELASMLGVSRARVSLQLATWSDRGILDQRRGRLVVRGRQALQLGRGPGTRPGLRQRMIIRSVSMSRSTDAMSA